jgi:superfamily I DNA/RNA helicase
LNNGTELAKKLSELKLNSIEVYSQYISIIKGSFTSHLYPTNCISLEEYKKKGKKITDSLCLEVVYEICMEFENFKRKSNMFDIQDLTNFLIRQVLIELNDIKLIDYLFIDEIQDLTVSQIFLLILVSKHVKIYAGDTCQTISKINRFRFSELNNIFYNFQKVLPDFDSVNEAYLSLNYRLN